ncbi:MAG TPA: ATP-dependent DNA helicase RecG [Acidimicrobiia bacterium]|jgi:ATP-dependent DNA helicase RecG
MGSLAYLAGVDIQKVSGLAGKRGTALRKEGMTSVADLLLHAPRRYIDRTRTEPIALAPIGEEVTVLARVLGVTLRRPRRNLVIVEARVTDGTSSLTAVWFNQPYRERQLSPGTEVALSGKIERFRTTWRMSSPAIDVLGTDLEGLLTGRVVPIYPTVGGIGPGYLRRAIHNALPRARPIPDPLPEPVRTRNQLLEREEAVETIHFPPTPEDAVPARRRLVFDEFFRLELGLALQKRRQLTESRGISHRLDGTLVRRFLDGLPYELTAAQRRVMKEIEVDLASPHPMHRLLQGEVGSGKTVVAVASLLFAVEEGAQGAVMAPTEVLADQHFQSVRRLLELSGLSPAAEGEGARLGMDSLFAGDSPVVRVAVLTSSQARTNYDPSISRSDLVDAIGTGKVDLVIGTHALIQEGVHFANLAIAVVDEQHRFGVGQRVLLKEKAAAIDPDLLIMTATPIPRTLSMTLYGDLDVSVIDEMPPGRQPVKTLAISSSYQDRAWELVRQEVAKGNQAFVVCPLVEDSPKIELASAIAEQQRLQSLFPDLTVGLMHGQLHPRDKEAMMAAFRRGEVDVLVATTVIEVGIDVPNATIMVIEDADRFGLSQLHQLRGRVGRGADGGICVLLADAATEEGEIRIEAMVESNDGFRLAETDLQLRGQGTVFGARQSGMADLKLADLFRDFDELVAARREAFALVDQDPRLEDHPDLAEEVRIFLGERVEWLFKS